MSGIKKKRVSKKNKASWRKYTDIKDVEDFLEDQRLEERVGKPALKKDEELFAFDTTGENGNQTSPSTKKNRRGAANKPLRSLAILENTSKVEDPVGKRNHVKSRKSGRNVISQVLAGKMSKRIIQSLHDSKQYSLKLRKGKEAKRQKIFRNDLWEEKDVLTDHPDLKNEWIDEKLATYHLHNTGKRLIPRPTTADLKTTKCSALELPHPGMSYNPSLNDHQDLMNQVLEKENAIIKQEKHLKRVTVDMFSKMTAEDRDRENLKQASFGLDEENNDDDTEEKIKPDIEERLSVNPPVQNKKKDKKARRKQHEQRELLQERRKIKSEKKKITDLHRLKAITVEVVDEEKNTVEIKKRRKRTAEARKYEPRRLAKQKFDEPEIPINMIQDLSGNLRNMKTESSILVDRFKSLQRRNILAPSVDVGTRKRRKIKRFVRNSHKEEAQPIKKRKMK